jgi:hypothetical protein
VAAADPRLEVLLLLVPLPNSSIMFELSDLPSAPSFRGGAVALVVVVVLAVPLLLLFGEDEDEGTLALKTGEPGDIIFPFRFLSPSSSDLPLVLGMAVIDFVGVATTGQTGAGVCTGTGMFHCTALTLMEK